MKVLLILGVIGTFFYILDTWKMYRLWKQGEQMVSYKACAAAFGGLILMKVFEVLKAWQDIPQSVGSHSQSWWQLQWFYSCFFIFMRTWSGIVKISLLFVERKVEMKVV